MKKMVISTAVFMLLGMNVYAGNGDLAVGGNANVTGNETVSGNETVNGTAIVRGSLGIGTTTPQAKVDVNGAIRVNGVTFGHVVYANLGEDVFGASVGGRNDYYSDTCDGIVESMYSCAANEERSCQDAFHAVNEVGWSLSYYRSVTCLQNGYLTIR